MTVKPQHSAAAYSAGSNFRTWLHARVVWRPVVLVAALGVVATLGLILYQLQAEQRVFIEAFTRAAEDRLAAIELAFELNVSHLMGLAALVAASQEVTAEEFQEFVTYERHVPSVARVMMYAPMVPGAGMADFEARHAADIPGFRVWHWGEAGQREAKTADAWHLPVLFAAPLHDNEAVLGFDLLSQTERRAAIEHALEHDAPAMSGTIRPIQARDGVRAFSVVAPVYNGGASSGIAEPRQATGVVAATTYFEDLVERALGRSVEERQNIFLFSSAELHQLPEYVRLSDTPGNPLRDPSPEAHAMAVLRAQPYAFVRPIAVAGGQFLFVSVPARSMAPWGFATGLTFAIALLGAAGTLGAMLYTLRRAQSAKLVARHAAVHAAMINSSTDAYLSLDAAGRMVEWSARAAELFGWPAEDILGRDFSAAVLPPSMRARMEAALTRLRECDCQGEVGQVDEYIAVRRDGVSFPAEVAITATRLDDAWRYFVMVRDLSARQRAEMERRALRDRADRVLASISEGFLAFDSEWRFGYVNARGAAWMGQAPEELIGKTLWEACPWLSAEARVAFYQAASERTPMHLVEYDAARARWVERNIHPYEDGVAVFLQDITERKTFEEALRRSEHRLRLALDAAEAGLWSWEPDGETWHWSERFREQLGLGAGGETASLAAWLAVVHVDDAARVRAVLQASMATGAPDSVIAVEYRAHVDGAIRWLRLHGRATRNHHAEVLGIQLDVTASRRDELARREAEGMARVMFEHAQDGILMVDCGSGEIVDANRAFCSLVGEPVEALRGRRAATLHAAADRDIVAGLYERDGARPGHSHNLTLHDAVGADIPVEAVFGEAQQHGDSHVLCGVFRDLTERRRSEEQLRHAYKMEAIGQLTGGLAHDFNNLLGVVIGHLDLIESVLGEDERARQWLEVAQSATMRGAALTKALLAVARRQPLDPEDVDVNGLLRSIMPLIRNTVGPTVEVLELLQESPVFARIDPGGLENAVLNLAINARDAMPEGGRLIVTTARHDVRADDAEVPDRMTPGVYAVVELADTGTGMDEATLRRAFEPFFTTKESGRGTGLGLAMVYGFAKQSGGHATIYSELGHGTSIRLYLPWGAASPVRAPAAVAPQPVERGHETVVIVDDEEALLGIGRMWLEKLGYEVIAYSDPHAALAHIARGGTCDVLVTDVVMPSGLDGPALAHKAREHRPGLPVLLTSGFAERSIRRTQALPGPLLQKPYRQGDLGRMVRQVLDGK